MKSVLIDLTFYIQAVVHREFVSQASRVLLRRFEAFQRRHSVKMTASTEPEKLDSRGNLVPCQQALLTRQFLA